MGCCDSKVKPKGELDGVVPDTQPKQQSSKKYDGEIEGWSEHLSDNADALAHAETTVQKDGKTYAKYWYFKGDDKNPPVSSYSPPVAFLRAQLNSPPPLPSEANQFSEKGSSEANSSLSVEKPITSADHKVEQAEGATSGSSGNSAQAPGNENTGTMHAQAQTAGSVASTEMSPTHTSAARHEELIRQPTPSGAPGKMKLAPIVNQPGAILGGGSNPASPLEPLTLAASANSIQHEQSSAVSDTPEQAASEEAARLNNLKAEAIRKDQEDSENPDLLTVRVRFVGSLHDGQLSTHDTPAMYRFHVKMPVNQKLDTGGTVGDLQEMICMDFGFSTDQIRLFNNHFECSKTDHVGAVIGSAYLEPTESHTLPAPVLDAYATGEPVSPPEYVFRPTVSPETYPIADEQEIEADGRDWCGELARVQTQSEAAASFKDMAAQIEAERQLHELLSAFTQTASYAARQLVDDAAKSMAAAGKQVPWYSKPNGDRKFVRQQVVLQEVRDWYVIQSQSEGVNAKTGKRGRKGEAGQQNESSGVTLLDEAGLLARVELRGLQAVRDCNISGLVVPLCALVEHCGVTFLATATLPGQSSDSDECALVYGSHSQGLWVEDGTRDDEAVVKARQLSSVLNLRPHQVLAKLTQRVHTIALPLHSQIYRVGGRAAGSGGSGGSGGTGESGGTGSDSPAAYFFCGGWRIFPRAVTVDGDVLPMWQRLSLEAFQTYGHKQQLADGWTFLTSNEPVKCSESGQWITDLEYYRYERRNYSVSMAEYEKRKADDNFQVPGNKLKLYKVPRGLQKEYYKNFTTDEEVATKPINLTPINPDWCEMGDKQGATEVQQLVCYLLPKAVVPQELKNKAGKGDKNAGKRSVRRAEAEVAAAAAAQALANGEVEPGTGIELVDLVEDLLPIYLEADDSDSEEEEDEELEEAELSISTGGELAKEMESRGLSVHSLGMLLTHLTAQMKGSSKSSTSTSTSASPDPAQDHDNQEPEEEGEEQEDGKKGRVVPAHLIEICMREIVARSMQATVLAFMRSGSAKTGQDGEDEDPVQVVGGSKFTSQQYLIPVMRRYINLLMEPAETFEGVPRTDSSAILWKKISKFSARNFGQAIGHEAAGGMSKAPLLHAVCAKLNVRLARHAGFDFESAEPLGQSDIAEVGGEKIGLELKSTVVARLTEEGRALDAVGQMQTFTQADTKVREEASAKLTEAVEAAAVIYGHSSQQMANACMTLAEVLEAKHAEAGNPMYSKWNHCALVQQDRASMVASEMYTRASEWYSTQGASLPMARCLVKLAHLSKEHQDDCNATPAPSMSGEDASLDCNCIDKLVAAMDLTESLCSEMHPDTADLYMKLAGAYQDMASPEDASPWLRKSFHVYAGLFTTKHSATKDCWSQLKDVETALNSPIASVPIDNLAAEIANLGDEEEWSESDEDFDSDDA